MRKKQWKKILSLVLALAMVFSMNTSVFAAEVPAAEPAAEAEAAEPAAEPAAEAPAAEAPAAEAPAEEAAPAAEAPAEEAAPAAETPAAEEPKAEEPKAEAEEPAAEAVEEAAEAVSAEKAPAEEAAEEAPKAEAEEAAGNSSDFNFNGATSTAGGITVSAVNASYEGYGVVATVVLSADSTDIYGVSLNKPEAVAMVPTAIIVKGDNVSINKIFVSGNSGIDLDNDITSVILSGNKIAYNDDDFYRVDTETAITSDVGVAPGHIYTDNDGLHETGNAYAIKAVKGYIYEDKGIKMSVSLDDYQISFNKATSEVYYGGDVDNKISSKTVAVNEKIDVSKLASGTAIEKIFAKLGDDQFASASSNDGSKPAAIPEKNDKPEIGTIEASANGAKIPISHGTHYVILNGEVKVTDEDFYDTIRTQTNNWKASAADVYVVGKQNKTTYTVVVRNHDGSKLTNYAAKTFKTGADAPAADSWEATLDWKATKDAKDGTELVVSVDKATKKQILINNVKDGDIVYLQVSGNDTTGREVNGVILSVNDTSRNNGEVILIASANGVTVTDTSVYAMLQNKAALKAVKDVEADYAQVVLNGKKYSFNETELKNGSKVYNPKEITDKGTGAIEFDYDKVTVGISGNSNAKLVYGAVDSTVKISDNVVATPADYSDLVGPNSTLVFDLGGTYGYFVKTTKFAKLTNETTISAKDARSFTIANGESDIDTKARFAYSETEFKDVATLKKEADFSISLDKTSHDKKIDVGLEKQGTTYYVYTKVLGSKDSEEFSQYILKPVAGGTTLGLSFNVIIVPKVTKNFKKGDTIDSSGVSYKVKDGQTTVSAGEIRKIDDDFVKELVNVVVENYSVSTDDAFKTGGTIQIGAGGELKSGKTDYVISANVNPDGKTRLEDTVKVSVENGTFYVMDNDSTLKVTPNKFYYGQSKNEIAKYADAYADGDHKIVAETLFVDTVSDNGKHKDVNVETLSANESFMVKFYMNEGSTISTGNAGIPIEVNARPVKVAAARNYFSKFGDKNKASANKIDWNDVYVLDLYGTGYDEVNGKEFYLKDKNVTPDFTNVDTTANIVKTAQDYALKYTLTSDVSKNGANYDITNGAYEGFGYYVAPVYAVTYTGKINGISLDDGKNWHVVSDNEITFPYESDAAVRIAELEKNYANTLVDDYNVKATIELPTEKEITVNKGSKFTGWKQNGEAVEGTVEIEADAEYVAVVREGVPGFSSAENGLSIVFNDSVTYTGLKHVTDPYAMMNSKRFEEAGPAASIEKVRDTANKNTGDVDLEVYVGDKLLIENYDYTAKYKNNVKAYVRTKDNESEQYKKAPQVTITFKNGYKQYPTVVKTFDIKPASIDPAAEFATVTGTGLESRVVKTINKDEPYKLFKKSDLVNIYTGQTLKIGTANKPESKDLKILSVSNNVSGNWTKGDVKSEGLKLVTLQGTGNYKGNREVEVLIIGKKVKFTTQNFDTKGKGKNKKSNPTGISANGSDAPFDATDSYWTNYDKITADIQKGLTLSSADINIYRKKADYLVPGAKTITYKAYDIDAKYPDGYVAYKGNYKYNVGYVDPNKIKVKWLVDKIDGKDAVYYNAAGATIAYDAWYTPSVNKADGTKEIPTDLSKIFKIKYSNNKKVGTAKAQLQAKNGKFFDRAGKDALKKDSKYTKEFTILAIDLEKALAASTNNMVKVRSAYVVKADFEARKPANAIKSTGSIVLVDAMGNIVKNGSDYVITDVKLTSENKATASGDSTSTNQTMYNVTIEAKTGKNAKYTGKATIQARQIEGFLGKATVKFGGNGHKTIDPADIASLADDTVSDANIKFAQKYGITVKGKVNGKTAELTQKGNYDLVVTQNAKGGKAYITAVGIDGGKYGDSDVLAAKQINKNITK